MNRQLSDLCYLSRKGFIVFASDETELHSEIFQYHLGVVGLGVVAFGVVAPLSPAALLFLLDFFSLVLGVVGLFSLPFVTFLTGPGRSSVFSSGVGTALFAGVGTSEAWLESFETS